MAAEDEYKWVIDLTRLDEITIWFICIALPTDTDSPTLAGVSWWWKYNKCSPSSSAHRFSCRRLLKVGYPGVNDNSVGHRVNDRTWYYMLLVDDWVNNGIIYLLFACPLNSSNSKADSLIIVTSCFISFPNLMWFRSVQRHRGPKLRRKLLRLQQHKARLNRILLWISRPYKSIVWESLSTMIVSFVCGIVQHSQFCRFYFINVRRIPVLLLIPCICLKLSVGFRLSMGVWVCVSRLLVSHVLHGFLLLY